MMLENLRRSIGGTVGIPEPVSLAPCRINHPVQQKAPEKSLQGRHLQLLRVLSTRVGFEGHLNVKFKRFYDHRVHARPDN